MANYTDSYSNVHELMWDTFNTSNSSGRDINISSITTSLFPHDSIANDSSFGQNLTSQSPWESLSKAYQRVHGYLAFAVCVFGIISNVLNIIVLTRKHMRSPVNFILTALAIADIMTMSPYTVMAMYLYIINK